MFNKFFNILSIMELTFAFTSPTLSHASKLSVCDGDDSTVWLTENDISVSFKQIQLAEQLSEFFIEDEDGGSGLSPYRLPT